MRLKLYCNRYAHFKDALVCSVNCVYRTRCQDFALFYDEHRDSVDALVADYYAARREPQSTSPRSLPVAQPVAAPTDLRALIRLEVKREMAGATYIWVDKDDRAELIETEEVLRRAERGAKAKHIYKISQEMELRFQLVPRKRIEKARRAAAAEAERTTARRTRVARAKAAPTPSSLPAPAADEPRPAATTPRRTRTRATKIAGER